MNASSKKRSCLEDEPTGKGERFLNDESPAATPVESNQVRSVAKKTARALKVVNEGKVDPPIVSSALSRSKGSEGKKRGASRVNERDAEDIGTDKLEDHPHWICERCTYANEE